MTSLNKCAVAAGLWLVAAAPAAAKLMEDTVAVVNGTPIMLTEYAKEITAATEYWNKVNPMALSDPERLKDLREKTLEQLIDNEVLHQEGGKLKIKVRERDVDMGVEEIKKRFSKDETGKPLTEAEAEAAFAKQLKHEGLSPSQFRERLGKQVMARKVIDQEVKARLKSPEEKEVKGYFDQIKAFLLSKSTATPKGMDEESGMAFREIAQQIKALSSERVRVSRILVKFSPGASAAEKKRALKTAQSIKKRLNDGENFAELAKSESEDPDSAAQGGDIGFIVRGITPPDFEKIAFSLGVGDVSEPIETEFGYHIIRIQEKRAAEAPDYERFKEQLGQFLMNVNAAREVERYVKNLKAKAVVERHLPAAP